jgi:hypothetical protein
LAFSISIFQLTTGNKSELTEEQIQIMINNSIENLSFDKMEADKINQQEIKPDLNKTELNKTPITLPKNNPPGR